MIRMNKSWDVFEILGIDCLCYTTVKFLHEDFMGYLTEQENFWAGDFGDDYIARNSSDGLFTPKSRCGHK